MNDDEKKELLILIEKEWSKFPTQSFCDFVSNLVYVVDGHSELGLSDDRKLLEQLRKGVPISI